ncbi:hypothetical protein PIROE2DRAFT_16477 [Piromyces sp. E2]|nr:hypothetical protein PIROE2DRAFT_16477 [Piromyces sp. E2]|eukprot:OUM58291.1 hypothetical protein PIROE2DRAFT_16477 [Piromyces sp. E2]
MEDITSRFKGYNEEQISIALQSEFSLSNTNSSSSSTLKVVDDCKSLSSSNQSCFESPYTFVSEYDNDYCKNF